MNVFFEKGILLRNFFRCLSRENSFMDLENVFIFRKYLFRTRKIKKIKEIHRFHGKIE
jgi:hypothetical protein